MRVQVIILDTIQYLIGIAFSLITLPLQLIVVLFIEILRIFKSTPHTKPQCILITGASSGIGKGVAELYAQNGVTLLLTGRNVDRLSETAQVCRSKGSVVFIGILDVTNKNEMEKWIKEMDQKYPIDLVIANAGVSSNVLDRDSGDQPLDLVNRLYQVFDININGVLNTICPVIESFCARKKGQIAIVSSPGALVHHVVDYAASKGCVTSLALGLRDELRKFNVKVNLIAPGYVVSGMTAANEFPMPFLLPTHKAANYIKNGLERDDVYITFPFILHVGAWLVSTIPANLRDNLYHFVSLFHDINENFRTKKKPDLVNNNSGNNNESNSDSNNGNNNNSIETSPLLSSSSSSTTSTKHSNKKKGK